MNLNELLPWLLGAGGTVLAWRFGRKVILEWLRKALLSALGQSERQSPPPSPSPVVTPTPAAPQTPQQTQTGPAEIPPGDRQTLKQLLAQAASILDRLDKGEGK